MQVRPLRICHETAIRHFCALRPSCTRCGQYLVCHRDLLEVSDRVGQTRSLEPGLSAAKPALLPVHGATSHPRALDVVSCPVQPTETAGGAGPATGAVLTAESLSAALRVSPGPGHQAKSPLTHQAWHLLHTTPTSSTKGLPAAMPAGALPAHEGHPSLPLAPGGSSTGPRQWAVRDTRSWWPRGRPMRPQDLKQHFLLWEPRKHTSSFNPESTF